jgi:hypothetical protein
MTLADRDAPTVAVKSVFRLRILTGVKGDADSHAGSAIPPDHCLLPL